MAGIIISETFREQLSPTYCQEILLTTHVQYIKQQQQQKRKKMFLNLWSVNIPAFFFVCLFIIAEYRRGREFNEKSRGGGGVAKLLICWSKEKKT